MYIKEFILLCYIICIALGVAGITCCTLSDLRSRTALGKNMLVFMVGLLVMCFYDMMIYYCNYVIGIFSSMEVMRIGSCIIAGNMFLWARVHEHIIERDALKPLSRMVSHYTLFYSGIWLILTVALSVKQFYALKWLLLTTDILLIVAFLALSVARIVYASVAGERGKVYYMTIVTALLLWNYISYFWSETSVYWGNSDFIRAPMDLTIVIWLVINAANVIYAYRYVFQPAFAGREAESPPGAERTDPDPPAPPVLRKPLAERIEEVQAQYKLTPREKEFVELIYRGKSNREIAEMLFLSESTVKTHIYNIFRKMDVRSRINVICIINEEELSGESEERNGNEEKS